MKKKNLKSKSILPCPMIQLCHSSQQTPQLVDLVSRYCSVPFSPPRGCSIRDFPFEFPGDMCPENTYCSYYLLILIYYYIRTALSLPEGSAPSVLTPRCESCVTLRCLSFLTFKTPKEDTTATRRKRRLCLDWHGCARLLAPFCFL